MLACFTSPEWQSNSAFSPVKRQAWPFRNARVALPDSLLRPFEVWDDPLSFFSAGGRQHSFAADWAQGLSTLQQLNSMESPRAVEVLQAYIDH